MKADDRPPETVGNFRVIRRLTSGGTSDVLLARPIKPAGDHRPVVLKMLLPQYQDDPAYERMLAKEAEAYGRLHHPFIVQLFEVFAVRDKLVIVLEYVDGLALNRLRAQLQGQGQWLDDRASAYLVWCIFSALSAAHNARDPETGIAAPVIHRDINPSNVLIPWDGRVKIADFSIAKVIGVTGDTKAGITKGTFGYMAPEQVRGEKITERVDIYTATLLLWEQFARRKAIQYSALPEIEVMRAMAYPHLVSLDVLRPDLPETIRRAVATGLEADPAKRELSADDMVAILRDFVSPDEGRRLLQDTLYRLREGEEESTSADRSWAKMTPISSPDASYNGGTPPGSVARGEDSLPAFPLESLESPSEGGATVRPSFEPRDARASDSEVDRETLPTSSFALGALMAPPNEGSDSIPVDTEMRGSASSVSFSELLLPRSAEPMTTKAESTTTTSSVPPPDPHQATLLGGIEVRASGAPVIQEAAAAPPAGPFITQVDEHEAPTSRPPPVEETLVSPAPPGIPTPSSKSVPVSLSGEESPMRIPVPDLMGQTIPTDPLIPPAVGGTSNALAATVPAIPSQLLPQMMADKMKAEQASAENKADVAPASAGGSKPGTMPWQPEAAASPASGPGAEPQKSKVAWWIGGAVALFAVGVGAASLFVRQQEPPSAAPVTQAGSSAEAPGAPGEAPGAPGAPAAAPLPSGAAAAPSEPAKPEAPKAEPAKPEPAKAEPAKPESAKPEPAKPEHAKPEPAKPEPPKAEVKEPAAPAPAKGDDKTGTLVVERGGGHRIFLDGKVVGQGAGSHTVPCGRHTIKVGSDGAPQELTIPCGGTVNAK
ncbi:protein kinase domain-containing protein [Pendulispora albinea]|uniref:Protein kinase n=1 Tax=Pendulispora albinea TaxID=2741071 RepID=A0ABZ2M9T2_9BACT